MNYQNDLILRAMHSEHTERTPIWLMRQAGRTDPKYLAYRDATKLSLEDLFRHPEHAAAITLLPERLGVDALIFYQDILTPLSPMGAHFVFRPGPVLEKPLDTPEDIDGLHVFPVEEHLSFVGETFDRLQKELNGRLPVLGFAGAPMTLAVFILEAKSFGHDITKTRIFMREYPEILQALLNKITDMTIAYLKYQAQHGAAALQLFESAAFALTPEEYRQWALPSQQKIFSALKGIAPTINFAREWNNLADLTAAGADILSLPETISIADTRAQLGENTIVQGNLDNKLLCNGTPQTIEQAVLECIRQGQHRGHIFNLSHGLLKETPFENVQHLVNLVRETKVSTS